jgi:Na+/phosphate symporter
MTKDARNASENNSGFDNGPLTISETALAARKKRSWWEKINFGKIGLFVLSLILFVQAITLMKDSAHSLTSILRNIFDITNAANSLGFGWLFGYAIMSGSPVAAAALAFMDVGAVDRVGAFAMITGSRLGANFIVLLIGFLYILRGRDRATSLSMGLLSFTIAASINLPALPVGAVFLRLGWLDSIRFQSGAKLQSATDATVGAVSQYLSGLLPEWIVFLLGLGVIFLSFKLFDQCLPQMRIKESQVGWMSRLVYRPIVMFFLGSLVTLISMSVSISLSILVPLSNRGFVRRENVIPYIMGANITTFVDTLLAAVLLQNPDAFTVVFVQMIAIMIVSLLILMLVFQPYQQAAIDFANWVTKSNKNLAVFIFAIFLIPVILMFF